MSRLTGFARDMAIAGFFGTGLATSAYAAALRIPNTLRNLLGEGTLSASFIPVYSGLLGRGEHEDARRLAGTTLGVLTALAAVLSALGVLLAPLLTWALVPGWEPAAQTLTTRLVRILFPMAGFMILAAWCLGVLNSHRRFLLPFAAPAVWNLAQVGGLFLAWWVGWEPLIVALAWATLIGGALQFLVQLPSARRLLGSFKLSMDTSWEPVRRVLRNAPPVMLGAGIAQLSGLIDVVLASLVGEAALAVLYFAQRLHYLPLGLFGTAVAAASLPELSREAELAEREALRERLRRGFRNILFAVLPTAAAFILFGDWIIGTLFQRGDFTAGSTALVHATLAAYAIGLPAASSVKLFASGFHAMLDTRTPVRYAVVGLGVGTTAAAILMWPFYSAGLALGASLGAWIYLALLWRGLRDRLGPLIDGRELSAVLRILGASALASAAAAALLWGLDAGRPEAVGQVTRAVLTAGTIVTFGVVYLVAARVFGVLPAGGLRVWMDRGT